MTPNAAAQNSSLARERELLERAQRLCVQGNPTGALQLVDTHAREFPSGSLTPERIALRTRAMSLLAAAERDTPSFVVPRK
jgi:hypothetical protein